jgi:hypothetical protein
MSAGDAGEGFLARWSRLKRDPEKPPASPEPARPEPTAAATALPEGKTLDELVAELPRLDELVPGQSLTAFMQAWVPADIRSAALRRMWLLDPAIRDYVNPALDYAYDYNALGGAPGYGPMETSAEMVREVNDMFARAVAPDKGEEGKARAQGNMSQAETDVSKGALDDAAPQHLQGRPTGILGTEPEAPPALPEDKGGTTTHVPKVEPDGDVAVQKNQPAPRDLPAVSRRHGGALPG